MCIADLIVVVLVIAVMLVRVIVEYDKQKERILNERRLAEKQIMLMLKCEAKNVCLS